MRRVVVAGSSGYVGRYVVRELKQRGYFVRALTRDAQRLAEPGPFAAPAVREHCDEVFVGEATRPETLHGLFDGIDVAFSSLGISRQRDGLSFAQVDFAANRNVFEAASAAGTRKLIYVSLWDPDALAHLAIVRAHEQVVALLRASGVAHCVVRPSGYFSDMGALMDMARRGRAFVVGSGSNRMNPIHGADVARVCADAIESPAEELGAGGPDVLTQQQAAELAFEVLGKPPKLLHLPVPLLRGVARVIGLLNRQFGDLAEFLVTAGEVDGVAPRVGTMTLRDYFTELARHG